jgi:hypothetical protein
LYRERGGKAWRNELKKRNPFAIRKMEPAEIRQVTSKVNRAFAIRILGVL